MSESTSIRLCFNFPTWASKFAFISRSSLSFFYSTSGDALLISNSVASVWIFYFSVRIACCKKLSSISVFVIDYWSDLS